jgi:hypothetical protein
MGREEATDVGRDPYSFDTNDRLLCAIKPECRLFTELVSEGTPETLFLCEFDREGKSRSGKTSGVGAAIFGIGLRVLYGGR